MPQFADRFGWQKHFTEEGAVHEVQIKRATGTAVTGGHRLCRLRAERPVPAAIDRARAAPLESADYRQ